MVTHDTYSWSIMSDTVHKWLISFIFMFNIRNKSCKRNHQLMSSPDHHHWTWTAIGKHIIPPHYSREIPGNCIVHMFTCCTIEFPYLYGIETVKWCKHFHCGGGVDAWSNSAGTHTRTQYHHYYHSNSTFTSWEDTWYGLPPVIQFKFYHHPWPICGIQSSAACWL